MNRSKGIYAFCLVVLVLCQPIYAQSIAVELDTEGNDWVPRNQAIELVFDAMPTPEEGRLAILVGTTDLTDLFARSERGLRYQPHLVPLPAGESEITVFLVAPTGEWQEVSRLPLRVLRRGGLERLSVTPRLDIQGKGQFDESVDPEQEGFEANTYEDATVQADLRVEMERSGWMISNELNVVGVTNIEEALRFGEEGENADKIDLSRYSIRLTRGRGFVELGHVSYGSNQHLISGHSARGVVAQMPLGSFAEISAAWMNGTSIVGWNNILGLNRSEHQIKAIGLGLEVVPSHKGALRVEGTWMDGSLSPESSFNQGNINDAETSEGWGVRLLSNTVSSRLNIEVGYARSKFTNPFDPLLAQGDELVAVEQEDRDARYVNVRYSILQSKQLGEDLYTDLSVGLTHERVEPQYRSVAAFAQSDIERSGADLSWMLGAFNFQTGYSENEDNLDSIPSILTTKTESSNVNMSLAMPQLFQSSEHSSLWPMLNYGFNRTHQFGLNVPIDSGFSPSHVPDQLSRNHTASIQWQGQRWRFGYNVNYSDQDNRQDGREDNDFNSLNHGWSIGLTPHQRLDLGFDFSRERAFSVADDRIDRNRRWGMNLAWRITDALDFMSSYSFNESENDPKTSTSEGNLLDA